MANELTRPRQISRISRISRFSQRHLNSHFSWKRLAQATSAAPIVARFTRESGLRPTRPQLKVLPRPESATPLDMRIHRLLVGVLALAATSLLAADRLNVLFIATDDMNSDLGCYGNPIVQWRSHLDRLAREGSRALSAGMYADHLPRWLEAFGSRARVVFAEDFERTPPAHPGRAVRLAGAGSLGDLSAQRAAGRGAEAHEPAWLQSFGSDGGSRRHWPSLAHPGEALRRPAELGFDLVRRVTRSRVPPAVGPGPGTIGAPVRPGQRAARAGLARPGLPRPAGLARRRLSAGTVALCLSTFRSACVSSARPSPRSWRSAIWRECAPASPTVRGRLRPDLWDDPEKAQKVTSALSHRQSELDRITGIERRLDDLEVLVELAEGEDDAETLAEAEASSPCSEGRRPARGAHAAGRRVRRAGRGRHDPRRRRRRRRRRLRRDADAHVPALGRAAQVPGQVLDTVLRRGGRPEVGHLRGRRCPTPSATSASRAAPTAWCGSARSTTRAAARPPSPRSRSCRSWTRPTTSRSPRTTSGSTSSAPPGPVASRSTPPTPRCG